jgi:hypothetical protein
MGNQHNDVEKYPPGVQGVIDRFISGDIPVRNKQQNIPKLRKRPERPPFQGYDDYESALESLKNKKELDGNYYERQRNRGLVDD